MFAPLHSTWAKATCRILILGGTYFREVASQQHGSDPLQGPENNRWWRTHGKSPSRQQTNLLFFSPATTGGPMNSLRKWLYRPRRDDKSLLAKFWWVQFFISFPFFAFLYCVCRSPTKVQCQKQTKTWVQHTLASLWQSKCWHKRPNIQTPYFANFRWRPNTLECCSTKSIVPFPLCSHFLSLLFNTLSNHPLHHTLLVRTHFRKLKAYQIQRKIIGRLSYLNTSQSSGKLISLKCNFSILKLNEEPLD